MTKKWQQIKKLAYVTTCGPSGLRDIDMDRYIIASTAFLRTAPTVWRHIPWHEVSTLRGADGDDPSRSLLPPCVMIILEQVEAMLQRLHAVKATAFTPKRCTCDDGYGGTNCQYPLTDSLTHSLASCVAEMIFRKFLWC
eukprot:COSAG05_NODE_7129_length_852_cov_4.147410_1_plen_139_part_00